MNAEQRRGWLRRPRPAPEPAIRLLCLPHAGGTPGLFRAWPPLLPPLIEPVLVCLPGRENRLSEPLPDDIPALVAALAEAVEPLLDRPWALFGHSMGAAVGFELALTLRRRPCQMFLSAREPPQYHHGGGLHQLDDDRLCAELLRLGGTPPGLLQAPEVRAMVLPAVRHDYRLIETYHARPASRFDGPLTVFLGRDDPDLPLQEALGWREWTSGPFALQMFEGGHFYLADQPSVVVAAIASILANGPRNGDKP
ncbi:thioesterase II family protein [Magnetospirillum molischianum]|uniref:Oleoyl-(Acyl-carrier-protein) hydrolase n=1 Tax=Magnetospirillum molischianum DSM 120 TaxID=1150626 RepID=H8FS54_MAGML|nr:alpha/beta fold hydrolase [Magnetospirillum molischianum]CCG41192.1 Oleoyl-(Acyl-carrier-protein) hydrolase [Magnetospirillum molischianum DSM 120]